MAIHRLVHNRLTSFVRDRVRYRDFRERIQEETTAEEYLTSPENSGQLSIDVREAIEKLPPQEQQLCRYLAEGRWISEIAREWQCHHTRIWRMIVRIRRQFKELGLEAWLMPSLRQNQKYASI